MKKQSNVKVITLDGINYLGTIKGDKLKVQVGSMDFGDYVERKALGELSTITVGDAKNLVVSDLTKKEELRMAHVKGMWKIAKSQALDSAAVAAFRKLLGK